MAKLTNTQINKLKSEEKSKTGTTLTHSAPEHFEKLALKKKAKHPTLNAYISKTRTNSESKLKFSER